MARTYEEMVKRQKAIGPTGPSGPVLTDQSKPALNVDAVMPRDTSEVDSTVLNTPALEEDSTDVEPAEPAAPIEQKPAGPMTFDVDRAKRAVVLRSLRNTPAGTKMFAKYVRQAYRMPDTVKASDQEILQAAYDMQRGTISDLTPSEYEKAIHDLYGPKVDAKLLRQARMDYPGFKDEKALVSEIYRRKLRKEEAGPLSYEDMAQIVARRYPELHNSDLEPEKALRLRYDVLKKSGKNIGSFDDWMHDQMAPTLAERGYGLAGGIASGIKTMAGQVGTLATEVGVPGRLGQDIVEAGVGGVPAAQERLKQAGLGAVTAASAAAVPMTGGAIAGLEGALGAAKTAPLLTGAAEGMVSGGLQGGASAAIEGKSPSEIAQAATTNAGIAGLIGAGAGAYGGHVQKVRAAEQAVEAAAAEEAALKAATTEVPPPAPKAVPAPVETDVAELASRHNAEMRWGQVVKDFAAKHGMDPSDVNRLVAQEEPALTDLAAAQSRHGVTAEDISELRMAMPEHMRVAGPVAEAPVVTPTPEATPEAATPAAPVTPEPERGFLQNDVSERMTAALNAAQGQLTQRRAMIRWQLSRRLAEARRQFGAVGGGLAGWKAKLSAMAGEMKKPDWAGVADEFKDVDIGSLHDAIARAPLLEGDKLTAHAGLERLFNGTKMGAPTLSQIRVLRMAFGSDFAESAMQQRSLWQQWGRRGLKLLNTPRTIMSSMDLSAGMRQGYLMTSQPEYWRAWNTMVKSFGSQKVADEAVAAIKENPKYDLMRQSGLYFQGDEFGTRSETFAGSYADRWAGVHQSQRAYDTFINKLRADVYSSVYDRMDAAGINVTDPHFRQSLAHWINTGTGRGSMALLGRDAGTLNALAFSPRLAWSRFETFNPWYYGGLHPSIRVAALKANMQTIGATMALLGVMAGSGAAAVNWDPRNSDFAKLRFGNTRIDMLGGHQQLMRMFAQMVTGKVISSTTGREIDLTGSDSKNGWGRQGMTRLDVLSRFMEAKASPLASLAITMMRGKDFLGKPISIPNEIATRFTPMPIQDVADAIKDGGWAKGLGLVAPLAVVGLGTQTYTPNVPGMEKKPEQGVVMDAVNMGQRVWNHLNGIEEHDADLAKLTPELADQWVKDAAMAQVMGHHEATQDPHFYDKGFDQASAIRKSTARRMSRINKLYKDLMGGNGEEARVSATKGMLQRRHEATGMDIEALKNPNVYSEVSK